MVSSTHQTSRFKTLKTTRAGSVRVMPVNPTISSWFFWASNNSTHLKKSNLMRERFDHFTMTHEGFHQMSWEHTRQELWTIIVLIVVLTLLRVLLILSNTGMFYYLSIAPLYAKYAIIKYSLCITTTTHPHPLLVAFVQWAQAKLLFDCTVSIAIYKWWNIQCKESKQPQLGPKNCV